MAEWEDKKVIDLKIEQGNNFKNKIVTESWIEQVKTDSGTTHITSLIYVGNRWVNVDIAGGMRFNYPTLNKPMLILNKSASYDFKESLTSITSNWLLGDYNDNTVSKNFDSKLNTVDRSYW